MVTLSYLKEILFIICGGLPCKRFYISFMEMNSTKPWHLPSLISSLHLETWEPWEFIF